MRILVADDHDFQRSLEIRLLRDLGETDVTEARDGAEALASARANRPEVVISDLNMPGMDGMTFIRHLAQEKLADSLIIASGLAPGVLKAVQMVAVASGLRVLGAVTKPLHKDALASMLHLHRNPSGSAGARVIDAEAVERAIAMGQFKAWFMPILDVAALHAVAVAVTPRWESTEHGVLMGEEALAAVDALECAPAVLRAVIQGALAGGGLWRQLGWRGSLVIPLGVGALRDEELLDWLQARARASGMTGDLAISITVDAFAKDAPRATLALARAMMHGYPVTVQLREPADLDALALVTSCSVVSCPASWALGEPALMQRVREFATRMQADIGVTDLQQSQELGSLHEHGVRLAQGPAFGRPASAAETYDAHLVNE